MREGRKNKTLKLRGSKEFFRNTALVLLAVLWSVASYIQWAVEDRTTAFQIPTENVATIEMQQGDIFSQEIQINRFIKELKILTANGGGNRASINYGTLRFTLRQGDVSESCDIDIYGIADWSYVDFSETLRHFTNGSATLEIESLNTQYGSSLFIPYTGQDIYEIPAASFNGELLPGPLCVQYKTESPQSVNMTAVAVGIALLVAVIAAGVILTKWPKNAAVYCITVILVFLTICLKYPTYTIDGEAWAEVGALYIPSAQNNGFFQNLFTLESGLYLNTLGRLISWIVVHCMGSVSGMVLGINLLSLLVESMMGSVLATGALRKYITTLESVVISVLVTTCLVNAETCATPLITSYWGIIPMQILLAVMIFRVEISGRLYWLLGSMAIISTLSRMSFVIFIPILLMVAFLQRGKLTRRDIAFVVMELFACLFQGLVSLEIRKLSGFALAGGEGPGSINIGNPLRLLEQVGYAQVQFINTLFRIRGGNFLLWNLLLLAAIFGGGVFLLVCIVRKKHRQSAVFALAMLFVSFGNTVIQQLSGGFGFSFSGWSTIMDFSKNRQWVFSYIALLGVALMIFICMRRSGAWQRERVIRAAGTAIAALGMLIMCSFQIIDGGYFFYDDSAEIGDWKNYSEMASQEEFAIPVAPPIDWYYQSPNCQIQNGNIEKYDIMELNLNAQYAVSLYVHKDTWENQISLSNYYVSLYDRDGSLTATVQQISDPEEEYAGFDLDMPVNGISRVEFTLEDGRPAYVAGAYLVGYR